MGSISLVKKIVSFFEKSVSYSVDLGGSELSKCPICDHDEGFIQYYSCLGFEYKFRLVCYNCSKTTPFFENKKNLVSYWNHHITQKLLSECPVMLITQYKEYETDEELFHDLKYLSFYIDRIHQFKRLFRFRDHIKNDYLYTQYVLSSVNRRFAIEKLNDIDKKEFLDEMLSQFKKTLLKEKAYF